ncbi:MAG TPA: hypothetical protein VFW14_10805 [Gaiellales bacterium]|nr:hypothetical protein [Gaiellales bacterium]
MSAPRTIAWSSAISTRITSPHRNAQASAEPALGPRSDVERAVEVARTLRQPCQPCAPAAGRDRGAVVVDLDRDVAVLVANADRAAASAAMADDVRRRLADDPGEDGLECDQRERVPEQVVQVAGDPHALLGHGDPGPLVAQTAKLRVRPHRRTEGGRHESVRLGSGAHSRTRCTPGASSQGPRSAPSP